jgi:hypothetical protein
MKAKRNGIALVILSSGSIFEKGSIISSDKIATREGVRGALYVAKKPEPAAFAARCWGFVKSIVNKLPALVSVR